MSWAMGQGSYYPGAQTPQGVTAPSPQGPRDSPVTREPHPCQRVPHPAVGVACGVPAMRDPATSGAICGLGAHIPPPPSPALLCRCYPAPGLPGRPQPLPHHGHSCSPGPSPPLPLGAVSQLPGPTPAVAAFLWGKLAPVLSGCKEPWDPGGGESRRAGRRGRGDVPFSCSHGLSPREGTQGQGMNLCESLRAWPAAPSAGQDPPAMESSLSSAPHGPSRPCSCPPASPPPRLFTILPLR